MSEDRRSKVTSTFEPAVTKDYPRKLKWTCRYCRHPFERSTRKGLKVTCPECKRVQEGPAGIEQLERENIELRDRLSKRKRHPETPAPAHTKVAVRGAKPEPPEPPPAEPEVSEASPPPAPPVQPTSLIDKILFRVG